ncbi:MAG: D-glycero-beta-D-manno-heptose-7-phosphate kinase [Candidatus Omnitrophica bacterium]|nr:D-glycero-beta-D-manno-heptose-7-phosphate kinase [Candidatus Omnitrophota bacterium]
MTKARFRSLLKRFTQTRILVIGDLMLDEFIWGTVDRISPEAPVPVVWVERESAMPGGAANVAASVQALGGQARLVGVVGRDLVADRFLEAVRRQGLGTGDIFFDPARPTTSKTRVVAHHQQVVRIDRERVERIGGRVLERCIQIACSAIPEVDGVVVEDYGKGLIVPELLKAVVGCAKKHRKVITVDPKEEHFEYYKGVTSLTPNKKEASIAAGMPIRDGKSLVQAGRTILNKLKPETLLITLGEEGMALFQGGRGRPVIIPTVAQEVFDVSGAGDTVIAAFTLARAAGASFLEAAVISNAAAGVVVGKVGIATCSPDELERKMFDRKSRVSWS